MTPWSVAYSLGKIGKGNQEAIIALTSILRTISILGTTKDNSARGQAVVGLQEILTTSEQYSVVVSALKDCLSDEVHQNNFGQFCDCYELLWKCAANLPYPDFYHAWHSTPE